MLAPDISGCALIRHLPSHDVTNTLGGKVEKCCVRCCHHHHTLSWETVFSLLFIYIYIWFIYVSIYYWPSCVYKWIGSQLSCLFALKLTTQPRTRMLPIARFASMLFLYPTIWLPCVYHYLPFIFPSHS